MEALDTAGWLVDDLLDFSSDIGEEDDEEPKPNQQQEEDEEKNKTLSSSSSLKPTREQALPNIFDPEKDNPLFPVFQEEELEWLSNENIFPSIETCDILSEKPRIDPKHQSPVSILLDSSNLSSSSSSMSSNTTGVMSCCGMLRIPVRARSKRKRRRRSSYVEQKWSFWSEPEKKSGGRTARTTLGRKCTHCLSEKTPQWRAGPLGPKTLCNACGVRFKSGRLMPEYRPASSPTFLTQLHSNSHKKILEMRRQKQKMTSLSMDTG